MSCSFVKSVYINDRNAIADMTDESVVLTSPIKSQQLRILNTLVKRDALTLTCICLVQGAKSNVDNTFNDKLLKQNGGRPGSIRRTRQFCTDVSS